MRGESSGSFRGPGLGQVARICRYPVKSLVGEELSAASINRRGMVGDRMWAVRDMDGKLGSGKNTRRFVRMPGLLDLTARHGDDLTPIIDFPDGRSIRGDRSQINDALSTHVGQPVTLAREAAVSHFDDGPLHLVSSSSLTRLSHLHGVDVDLRRLRANMLIDTGQDARFDEDDWVGCTVELGTGVVLRVREPMVRCVMVNLAQASLRQDRRLLRTIGQANDTKLGLVVDVLRGGDVHLGDVLMPAGWE